MVDYDQHLVQTPWRWNGLLLCLGVPMYCLLLILSLSQFIAQPDTRLLGVAIYAMIQIYGPTLGSLIMILLVAREVSARSVKLLTGLALTAMLVATSAVTIYWSLPMLLSV